MKRFLMVMAAAAALALAPMSAAHADVPLPAPGKPVVSNVTATGATLTWAPSTGPVFRYSVQRLVNGVWQGFVSAPSTTVTLSGLAPGEYTVAAQSHALPDSGYTSSALSEPVTFTVGATQPSCRLDFWTWQGGYTANGTHTGQLAFTMPTGMAISYIWSAQVTTSGNQVTINANGRFGFGGTVTGTFVLPSGFQPSCVVTVNGQPAPTVIAEPDALSASEAGGGATFTVRLSAPPPSGVSIEMRMTGTAAWAMTPILLTFGPTDWDRPKSMTMYGVDDSDTIDNVTVVRLSAPGYLSDTVTITQTDNDRV